MFASASPPPSKEDNGGEDDWGEPDVDLDEVDNCIIKEIKLRSNFGLLYC